MYLKFKIDEVGNNWKVYECKTYEYKKFKLSTIIDFILDKEYFYKIKEIPSWLSTIDLIVVPDLSPLVVSCVDADGTSHNERVKEITEQHIKLINSDCMLFTITTLFDTVPVCVLTAGQVFVESDKGQTIGRFNLNPLK